jgi:hypothetical protein
VEIQISAQDKEVGVVATVQGPPELSQVVIRRELSKPKHDIEIGDGGFDDTFVVQGPLPFVCALLDAPVRRMLREANVEHKLTIAGGKLRIYVREEELSLILGLFRDLGQRFAETGDVPRRLAQNVEKDPEPGVRLRNLLVLVREYPDSPSTAEALRSALRDARPKVRLQAALESGPEGRGVLLELAEKLEDDEVSARAVAAFGGSLPLERLQPVLAGAQKQRRLETALVCLEALGGLGGAAVDTLAQVAEKERFDLAAAAARALGATGDPAAEPSLLTALERDSPELQMAAAEALGRVGSAAAVLPLQEAAERTGALRKAARQAIFEIQARLEGAAPGQLTLATTGTSEAGQLSLAPEAGQLSIAPDTAGRLSLPPLPPPPSKNAG